MKLDECLKLQSEIERLIRNVVVYELDDIISRTKDEKVIGDCTKQTSELSKPEISNNIVDLYFPGRELYRFGLYDS